MANNYSILQNNLLICIPNHWAQQAFLWACDRNETSHMLIEEEEFAHEVLHLLGFLGPMSRMTREVFQKQQPHQPIFNNQESQEELLSDLVKFMLIRHCHWRFPLAKNTWLD